MFSKISFATGAAMVHGGFLVGRPAAMNAASLGRRIALYKLGDFGRRCSGICIAPRKPGMYGAQGYGLVAQQQSSFSHKVNRVLCFLCFCVLSSLRLPLHLTPCISAFKPCISASDVLCLCFLRLAAMCFAKFFHGRVRSEYGGAA